MTRTAVARLRSLLPLLVLASACTGTPRGIEAVEGLEIDRYLGTWFEIARLDHPFERGLRDVTASYSRREDGGLRVLNRGFDVEEGAWQEAEGRAYPVADESIGMLKVSFFGPFYGGYNVIELDHEGYQWALVAGPSRSYLWILARSPSLDPEILRALVERAKTLGFAAEALIFVEHGTADRAG